MCSVATLWQYVGSLGTLASMHTMPQGNLSRDSQYPSMLLIPWLFCPYPTFSSQRTKGPWSPLLFQLRDSLAHMHRGLLTP